MLKVSVLATLIAALAIVTADYTGLLGARVEQHADFHHLVFEFVDADTRAPLIDVHVACTRTQPRSAPGRRSLCTESRGPEAGQTTVTFGVLREVRHGLLFSDDGVRTLGSDPLRVTFIAANHARSSVQLKDADLQESLQPVRRIILQRK